MSHTQHKDNVSVIFFSCRRLHLLEQTVSAFVHLNTYPHMAKHIIVNDSGDVNIHNQLKRDYKGFTLVLNDTNMGLIGSIDIGYSHITTDFFFHLEDDWKVIKGGFIEKSLDIMKERDGIEEVWLQDYNKQPLEPLILYANKTPYKLVGENHQKGLNGYNNFAWHGFTTAIGLKRISDYNKIKPYADIPWQGTIWHREQAIGERYHDLGYRSACLLEDYATNIGYGQSEYKTGLEK